MRSSVRNKWIWIGLIITLVSVHYIIQYDRIRIKETLGTAIDGVESARTDLILKAIAERYQDPLGYTRTDLRDIARKAFTKLQDIRVRILDQKIQVNGDQAEMKLQFRVVASFETMRGWVLGTPQEPAQVTILFKKEESGWKITSIHQDKPFF